MVYITEKKGGENKKKNNKIILEKKWKIIKN